MLGQKSEAFQKVLDTLQTLTHYSGREISIYLYGEVGCGKSKIAGQIHKYSPRRNQLYYEVDCGTLQGEVARIELFGCRRGAFTGAEKYDGYFTRADKGILFLDEVHHLTLPVQKTLFRILEEGKYSPVGDTEEKEVDVMIITASSVDIRELPPEKFMPGLASRLAVIPICIPPLRERREDLGEIAEYFIDQLPRSLQKNARELVRENWSLIEEYHWPGNLRELKSYLLQFGLGSKETFLNKVEREISTPLSQNLDELVEAFYLSDVRHFIEERVTVKIVADYNRENQFRCNKSDMAQHLGVDNADRLDTYLRRCDIEWLELKHRCLDRAQRRVEGRGP